MVPTGIHVWTCARIGHTRSSTVQSGSPSAFPVLRGWHARRNERRMISYRHSVDGIEALHLTGFFVGWPSPPSPEIHLLALRHSDAVVLAIDDETGMVVGYITAITDHVLAAYIPHLEVL